MDDAHELNGVKNLMSNGTNYLQVPHKYILPQNERPQLSEVSHSESIPVVDLQDLDGPNRYRVVEEIRVACEEDGFFQVHDLSNPLLIAMLSLVFLPWFIFLSHQRVFY